MNSRERVFRALRKKDGNPDRVPIQFDLCRQHIEAFGKKLGIKPMSEKEFTLANGDIIKRKMGGALYSYGEEKGHAPVIFGEKGDSNLLGAVTLESMGLILDPIRRQLLSLPMVLGGLKNK